MNTIALIYIILGLCWAAGIIAYGWVKIGFFDGVPNGVIAYRVLFALLFHTFLWLVAAPTWIYKIRKMNPIVSPYQTFRFGLTGF